MKVDYIAGRRRAIARAMAVFMAKQDGIDWMSIGREDAERRVDAAEKDIVEFWIKTGVVSTFRYKDFE